MSLDSGHRRNVVRTIDFAETDIGFPAHQGLIQGPN